KPVALIVATPQSGFVPLGVSFSGTTSYDPDGTISAYAWDFGDSAVSSAPSTFHSYNAAGTYVALLRVTDNAGSTASTTQTITVKPLPAPVLSGSVSGSKVDLVWTDSAGSSVSGWIVERKTKGGSWTQLATVNAPSFSDTPPRGTWTYRVKSFNAAA